MRINDSHQQEHTIKVSSLLVVLVALICIYAFTYTGMFRVDDEHILAARSQSLALFGNFTQPQVFGNTRVQALTPLGDQATQIEPAQAILGAGLYKFGVALGFGGGKALFLLNLILTALTAGIVYRIVKVLNYKDEIAIWCSLFFGIGSIAWPYATTYFRDVLAMFFSSVAILGWTEAVYRKERKSTFAVLLMIFGVIGGILSKNIVLVLVPALTISSIVHVVLSRKERRAAPSWVMFGLLLIVLAMITLLVSPEGPMARFHWSYYRFLLEHFWDSVKLGSFQAFLGPFLSPAKSIFLFSPPLVLSLIGIFNWKRHGSFTLTAVLYVLLVSMSQAFFYRQSWAGVFGWGLRFMLPALPALIVVSSPVVEGLLKWRKGRGKWILYSLLLLGAAIQFSGVVVAWHRVYSEWQAVGLDPFNTQMAWDPRFLAIPFHLGRVLETSTWQLGWLRVFRSGTLTAVFVPLSILGSLSILYLVKRRDSTRSSIFTFSRKWSILLLALAAIMPLLTLLYTGREDPYWGTNQTQYQESMEHIRRESQPTDAILLNSYGTPLWTFWMDQWDQPVPWYSLPYEIPQGGDFATEEVSPLSDEVEILLDAINGDAQFLWYISSNKAPDYSSSPEKAWLDTHYNLLESKIFNGDPEVEVRWYRLR